MHSLTYHDFYQTLDHSRGKVIILFAGPGCAACKVMVRALEMYVAQHQDIKVFEVDVEQNPGLAREFGFFHLPALYLWLDGHYHRPLYPRPCLEDIHGVVQQAMALPAEEAP